MALTEWRVVARTWSAVALAIDGATLVIEAPRPAGDAELGDVIARLAPHLAFGDARTGDGVIERVATSGAAERVVVGRLTRGATSIAYLVSSRAPIDVTDIIAAHLTETHSPFEHFAD